ncbi:lysine--tRNA ligase [Campylobacterota bacterium]|nr:lysine--tRNA ligase [Campylobacterota bacterium]
MIPDCNSYVETRLAKVQRLRELGLNPYDNLVSRSCSIATLRSALAPVADGGEPDTEQLLTIAGRVKLLRVMGKAAFATIEDQSGSIQLYLSQNEPDLRYEDHKKIVEVGDIIEAGGFGFLTKTGELTLHLKTMKLLTKSIRPLPEKFHGLQDVELRSRQRYLDLIMNPAVRENFIFRSRLLSAIRAFFEDRGFLEVETPMLHPIPGGANAKPFITKHNALGVDRYLRIAPELYLKRLIVGGFEAVFELNRCFRNEGMDATHNPEFTTIEFYWAYHRSEDLIKLTELLFSTLTAKLSLPSAIAFRGENISFATPFRRYTYDEALSAIGGVDPASLTDRTALGALAAKHGADLKGKDTLGAIKAELFDLLVEAKLIQPTFITDFPIEISPLSRRKDEDPSIADRFELFVGGYEIANGFSELNDPIDQHERFLAQVKAKEGGDDEGMYMDEDFVTALSYGMAPTAGEGIGIDRLMMLLTGSDTIRDVLLFPAMRPEQPAQKEEQ